MSRAAQVIAFVASLAALSACRRPDPWVIVDDVCQWDSFFEEFPPFDQGINGTPRTSRPTFPSVDCVEVLAEQMGADLEAFEDDSIDFMPDGRFDLLDGPDVEGEETTTLFKVMTGLRSPFVVEMGLLDELQPSRLLSRDFVERLQKEALRLDVRNQTNRAAFGYLTHHIRTLRPATAEETEELHGSHFAMARFPNKPEVIVSKSKGWGSGLIAFALLTHEARHHDRQPQHYKLNLPNRGDVTMDATVDSATGASLGIIVMAQRNLPGFDSWTVTDTANDQLTGIAVGHMANIETMVDLSDGGVRSSLFDKYVDRWLDPWQ